MSILTAAVLVQLLLGVRAYDNSRYDNFVAYWGQNSYGAANPNDGANYQKTVDFYCNNGSIDVIPISFLTAANSTGGLPEIDLSNICNPSSNPYFSGTKLLNCQFMASQISTCQSKGKILTISLGGQTGAVSFTTNDQATAFADTIWNLFLGGSSSTRPFGSAVLDGVDLDIEGGGNAQLVTFVNRLRAHYSGAAKKYYVTAAPQCPYPDGNLQSTLNAAVFDAVFVQFYNNPCGVQTYNSTNFNFGTWDYWARNLSKSKDTKIFLGAPASSTAGNGYVPASSIASMATALRKKFPSFGGVMVWDASQAFANGHFDITVKNAMVAAGGTGFTYPACSAPAFVNGSNYPGGSQVTYNGYIWTARYSTNRVPTANIADTGDWQATSACGGAAVAQSSSTTASAPSMSVASVTTTRSSTRSSTTVATTRSSSSTKPTTTSKTSSTAKPSATSTKRSSTSTTKTSTSTKRSSTSTTKTSTSTKKTSTTTRSSSTRAPTPTSSTTTPSSTAISTSGICAGVGAWASNVAYTTGQQVTYGGDLWTAKQWTQADKPGGAAGVWTDNGACATKRAWWSRAQMQ